MKLLYMKSRKTYRKLHIQCCRQLERQCLAVPGVVPCGWRELVAPAGIAVDLPWIPVPITVQHTIQWVQRHADYVSRSLQDHKKQNSRVFQNQKTLSLLLIKQQFLWAGL